MAGLAFQELMIVFFPFFSFGPFCENGHVHQSIEVRVYLRELNTPAALELILRCDLGPRTRKIKIWHPELVKLCHLGP